MNANAEASIEMFRQLAFISALIGGFSLALPVQLLAAQPGRRVVGWTIGFSMAATAALTVCALGRTLGAIVLAAPAAKVKTLRAFDRIDSLHLWLSWTFIASILLFLAGLGPWRRPLPRRRC